MQYSKENCKLGIPFFRLVANPPTNLCVQEIDPNTLEVSWTAPGTPASAGYRITVNSSGNSTSIDVTTSPHNITLQEGVHSIEVRSISHHHYPSEMVGPVEVTLGVEYTEEGKATDLDMPAYMYSHELNIQKYYWERVQPLHQTTHPLGLY